MQGDISSCVLQGLKMPYFSNKPAPTPGPDLPMPGIAPAVTKEPDARPAKRQKLAEETSKL